MGGSSIDGKGLLCLSLGSMNIRSECVLNKSGSRVVVIHKNIKSCNFKIVHVYTCIMWGDYTIKIINPQQIILLQLFPVPTPTTTRETIAMALMTE